MKQTKKTKAGNQCRKCTGGSVSSTKVTSREFGLVRCTKPILKQRFMQRHENNFYPWPFKASGIKLGSSWQVNLPLTDRTPVKPFTKAQHRVRSNSGIGLSVFRYLVEDNPGFGKHKLILQTQVGDRDFLYREFNLPGASECVDATEFRRQNDWLSFSNAKTGEIAITANICSYMGLCIGSCIIISRSTQLPYRLLNGRFGVIASTTWNNQKSVEIQFRWQKTMHSERMVELSKLRKLRDAAAIEFFHRFSEN